MNYILRTSVLATGIVLTAAIIAVQVFTGTLEQVSAAPSAPFVLSGYAWASGDDPLTGPDEGGVGWISLNCIDGGAGGASVCTSTDYNVQVNADMTVSGYAWAGGNTDVSGDVPFGWIKFGGLTGCPVGSCDARIISDGTPAPTNGWEMTGWARACAVFQSGCSGTLKSSTELGGWDGWISLNCLNTDTCGTSDYAVRINSNGTFSSAQDSSGSFAWGDAVMNWVNFSAASLDICDSYTPTPTYQCVDPTTSRATFVDIWCNPDYTDQDCSLSSQVCDTAVGSPTEGRCHSGPPSGTLSVSPLIVQSGQDVTVNWSSTAATSCTVTGGGLNLTGTSGGPITFNPTNQTIVTLTCDGVEIASTTVNVIPSVYES